MPDELKEFERLLARSESLGKTLPFLELRELARLYRLHSARLARWRSEQQDPDRVRHLNALCVRGYSYLYVPAQSGSKTHSRSRFSLTDAFANTWRIQLLALGLLIIGAAVGFTVASRDPTALDALVAHYPADRLEALSNSDAARAEFLARNEGSVAYNAVFGAQLFVHNTKVGLLSFATGILAAVPTFVLILYNGLMLGGFISIFAGKTHALLFWAWLIPHAIPELLAILLCSSAGLVVGKAVLMPGRDGIAKALPLAAFEALPLVITAVPLFVLAALIESFVRESALSTPSRFGIAATAVFAIVAYTLMVFLLARRRGGVHLDFLESYSRSASRIAR